jgi:DNA-binding NarL/FixJ family response regulator
MSPRVLIADDHPPTRAGVRLALERASFTICAEAWTADGAVEGALRERPDICLLDIHMPGSGIAAAVKIASAVPTTSIVMLTVSHEDEDLFSALRAGAVGYLLKTTDPERLPHALEGVMKGEAALPRFLVPRILAEFRNGSRRRRPTIGPGARDLTDREWEVLELLGEGLTTADIAKRLFISQATVRTHVASTLHKLRAPNRQAAVALLKELETRSA